MKSLIIIICVLCLTLSSSCAMAPVAAYPAGFMLMVALFPPPPCDRAVIVEEKVEELTVEEPG